MLCEFEFEFAAWTQKWLFVLEGIPPVVLGVVMLWLLPSRPMNGNAWMLTPEEQQLLESEASRRTESWALCTGGIFRMWLPGAQQGPRGGGGGLLQTARTRTAAAGSAGPAAAGTQSRHRRPGPALVDS